MAKEITVSIYIPQEGVECEHCALIVEKGLSKVDGIRAHKVEPNNGRAVVLTDDDRRVLPGSLRPSEI